MQILNKYPNMNPYMCYRNIGKVSDTNIDVVRDFISVIEELQKEGKSVYNINNFTNAREMTKTVKLVRIKKQEESENFQRRAGFALISSITIIGTLVMGIIIFMAVKAIVIG